MVTDQLLLRKEGENVQEQLIGTIQQRGRRQGGTDQEFVTTSVGLGSQLETASEFRVLVAIKVIACNC
jgi:hypothetical protein